MATAKPVAGTPLPSSNLLYPSIRAFWPFNDGSGTTLTEVKSSANATINLPATITWTTNDKGEPAVASAATALTTRGASVSGVVIPSLQNFAAEVRLKPGASDSFGAILCKHETANGLLIHNGKFRFYAALAENTAPTSGAWSHLVASFNNGTLTYYLNGVSDGATAAGWGDLALDTMFNDDFSETFVGVIDYIRIWNRALTAAEIISLRDDPMQVFNGGENPQPMMFVTT